MKKPLLILFMALSAVAWSVAGETLPPIHSRTLDEATRNKILLINEGAEPSTLDPQTVMGVPAHHIIMGLIEGLVGCHPTDQSKEVPGMADRWEHNDDYSVSGPFISVKTANGLMVIRSLLRTSSFLTSGY